MKRKIIYVLFVAACITACTMPFLRADKDVAMKDMKHEVEVLVNTKDFKVQDRKYVRKQYELNDNDYEDIICYGVPSAMEVNEFSVVKEADAEKRDFIMKQLQKRIDRQYKSFSGYGPRQADLLKKAELYEKGDYVIMIIHKDASQMKESINELF